MASFVSVKLAGRCVLMAVVCAASSVPVKLSLVDLLRFTSLITRLCLFSVKLCLVDLLWITSLFVLWNGRKIGLYPQVL